MTDGDSRIAHASKKPEAEDKNICYWFAGRVWTVEKLRTKNSSSLLQKASE